MTFTIWKYQKDMTNMIKRLSKRIGTKRERSVGVIERPFKSDVHNRFIILFVYYRLYLIYSLAGFLFDLDQSNICRDIRKFERLIR